MFLRWFIFGCCVFVLLSMKGPGRTAELTKLPVGILLAGEFSPTYIAEKRGFFEKNRLAVELMYFQGGSQAIQALVAGQIPITVTAGPEGVEQSDTCFHPFGFSRNQKTGGFAREKGRDKPFRFLFGPLHKVHV